jgi:serine phosphatase RsbU (regulator of sigma subunit)
LRKILEKLNLTRPTIARDLTFGLVVTMAVVFTLAGTGNYFFSTNRDNAALFDKANEISDNLSSVLVTPLWNLNTEEIQKILSVYKQSGVVASIVLYDEHGKAIASAPGDDSDAVMESTKIIYYDRKPIGKVVVSFSDKEISEKQHQIFVYTLTIFALMSVALVLATTILLKRFLNEPFFTLKTGLDYISEGNYAHKFGQIRQADLSDITERVEVMATEISKRESALAENRNKLEILNQAILDMFSCSNTESLIRTTMTITNKVCGVDHGWFLGKTETQQIQADGDEKSGTPPPLVCVRGHIFETNDKEVLPYIGKHDNVQIFTYPIKSRYRNVGNMTLSYDSPPDPSKSSLLKSIMSLANVAMNRQSFIRESAFIETELVVAETVQRSMLLEEGRMPANAVISYHYETVLRVGGDWFSIIESRDGNSIYVILGDVTGHGLAQGLVTTAMSGALNIIESMIHDYELQTIDRPWQIVSHLDSVIRKIAGKSNLRMTCVAAKIDFRDNKLYICNAGHTFPIMVHQKDQAGVRVESLARNQQHILGEDHFITNNHTYSDAEYEFDDDDLLVFYTDGLIEAGDAEGKSFHRKFHRHFSKMSNPRNVQQLKDDVLHLFRMHTGSVTPKDDICLLVVGKRRDAASRVA